MVHLLSKKSSKYLSWHRASVDFLDVLRNMDAPSKATKMDDRNMLLSVIEKWRAMKKIPKLSPKQFEKAHGFEPLPDSYDINRLYTELGIKPFLVRPKGRGLRKQVESLLPKDKEKLSQEPIVHNALSYVLSRSLIPIQEDWATYPKGLDYLTVALFTIQQISRITGTEQDWLTELQTRKDRSKVPDWAVLTLRPDGPTSAKWAGLINRFRSKIHSLRYQPLRQVCEHLKNMARDTRVTGLMVKEACGVKWKLRQTYERTWSDLQLLLTEHYVPSLPQLGLHYRFRFTPTFKGYLPLGSMCETLSLSDKKHKGLRIYVEPQSSVGPESPEDFEITADQQILSMRMDLFNVEKDSWEIAAFEESTDLPEDSPGWLYLETSGGDPVTLGRREMYLLSVLWAHRGSQAQRRVLLKTMGFTNSRNLFTKLRSRIDLNVLHLPSMEYLGIPDGTVVAVRGASREKLEDLTLWLIRSFPFVRLYRDLERGSLLAIIRVPETRASFFESMISQKRITDLEHITTTVKIQRTFYMTTLSRLHTDDGWKDPWA
jgi:hypothetical protein